MSHEAEDITQGRNEFYQLDYFTKCPLNVMSITIMF